MKEKELKAGRREPVFGVQDSSWAVSMEFQNNTPFVGFSLVCHLKADFESD